MLSAWLALLSAAWLLLGILSLAPFFRNLVERRKAALGWALRQVLRLLVDTALSPPSASAPPPRQFAVAIFFVFLVTLSFYLTPPPLSDPCHKTYPKSTHPSHAFQHGFHF